MISERILERVLADVRSHCLTKGYQEGPWLNPMTPQDCVSSFAMARLIIEEKCVDHCVSVAPEGHVYGYFFEKLGTDVLSVFVDYPPKSLQALDDLRTIRSGRVLIIEDDVISGVTLQMVVGHLKQYSPRSMSLFLGRHKEDQQLEAVPSDIHRIYIAENVLNPSRREHYEGEFVTFFRHGNTLES